MLFTYLVFYNWACKKKVREILRIYNLVFRILGFLAVINSLMILAGIHFFAFGYDTFHSIPRPSVWFYEPSYLATYMMFYYGINLYLYFFSQNMEDKKRAKLDLFLSIFFIAIITSTAGYIGLIIGILMLSIVFVLKTKISSRVIKRIAVLAGFSLVVYFLIVIIKPEINAIFVQRIVSLVKDQASVEGASGGRTSMWSILWIDFLKNPIVGVGAGAYQNYAKIDYPPSNVSLEILVTTGIVGGVAFLLFILHHVFLGTLKPIQYNYELIILQSMVFAFVLFFLTLQTNQNYLRPYMWMHLGLIAGIYSNIKAINSHESN